MNQFNILVDNFLNKKTLILYLFGCLIFLNFLIPPFQSPDDFNHFKRAYLLTQGEFVLKKINLATGGEIDNGLLDYMNLHSKIPYNKNEKYTTEIFNKGKGIKWQNEKSFSDLNNIAPYFPLSYLPQESSIMIGKFLNLSIDLTYKISRFVLLLSALGILIIANKIWPIPYLSKIILLLPMSIFLFGSSHPDIFIWAILFLILSCSFRLIEDIDRLKKMDLIIFFIILFFIFLLVSNRVVYAGLYLIPIYICFKSKNYSQIASTFFFICINFFWLYLSELNHGPINTSYETINSVRHFPEHLATFLSSIYSNLVSFGFYKRMIFSFIGNLGHLDARLYSWLYYFYIICLLILYRKFTFYLEPQTYKILDYLLLFISVSSFCLLYVTTFIKWIPIDTEKIRFQGRYLYPMLFIIFYINKFIPSPNFYKNKFFTVKLPLILFLVSFFLVIIRILTRYYI
jgi:uncharacterized membrane protein